MAPQCRETWGRCILYPPGAGIPPWRYFQQRTETGPPDAKLPLAAVYAGLERMAGVDVVRIRQHHPRWRMIGGFIPSVDHQTPSAVSLADYRQYVALLKEYAQR
jgi:hypothetical protein